MYANKYFHLVCLKICIYVQFLKICIYVLCCANMFFYVRSFKSKICTKCEYVLKYVFLPKILMTQNPVIRTVMSFIQAAVALI